ncbi:hypothetical protein M405DRAFT_819072, partial [Rhizopogon salebrosus TDB-379]
GCARHDWNEQERTCGKYDHSMKISWGLIRACIVRRCSTFHNIERAPCSSQPPFYPLECSATDGKTDIRLK